MCVVQHATLYVPIYSTSTHKSLVLNVQYRVITRTLEAL